MSMGVIVSEYVCESASGCVRVRSKKKEVMFEEVTFCLRGGEEAEKCPKLTKAETTRPSSAASRLIVRTHSNDGGKFPNEKGMATTGYSAAATHSTCENFPPETSDHDALTNAAFLKRSLGFLPRDDTSYTTFAAEEIQPLYKLYNNIYRENIKENFQKFIECTADD